MEIYCWSFDVDRIVIIDHRFFCCLSKCEGKEDVHKNGLRRWSQKKMHFQISTIRTTKCERSGKVATMEDEDFPLTVREITKRTTSSSMTKICTVRDYVK
jgi:hypothetical protein